MFACLDSTLPSMQSSSSPSSFLTAVQPSTATDPSPSASIEPPQMTSSPNHEFEPSRISPNPDESIPVLPTQSNIVDELEQ